MRDTYLGGSVTVNTIIVASMFLSYVGPDKVLGVTPFSLVWTRVCTAMLRLPFTSLSNN